MKYQGLNIQENVSLKKLTTFGIGGKARYFAEIEESSDVEKALNFAKENDLQILILGGGSNMILCDRDFPGLVISINIMGMTILDENEYEVTLNLAAGEVWDEAVAYTVENEWWGIENLSHIPGKVGASVVQNIGAYGQEVKDTVLGVTVCEKESGEIKTLTNEECNFGYRTSIFNTDQKGKYVILYVTLKLFKIGLANLEYLDLERYFQEKMIEEPTIAEIRKAVIEIRDSKLPHPSEIGNAGSFFKNLLLDEKQFQLLNANVINNFGRNVRDKLSAFNDIFRSGQHVKIPAGYLIDICGLKGEKVGGAQIHERSGLVIINWNGKAKAEDVLKLMKKVRYTVHDQTGMVLAIEPNLVGFTESEVEEYMALDEVKV